MTPTTSLDEAALLAAIAAPATAAEDTPRLVYADWLDENAGVAKCPKCHGTTENDIGHSRGPIPCAFCAGGFVPDGRRARAEFIRVQVELEGMPTECHKTFCDGQLVACPDCRKWKGLRKRQSALLEAHRDEWFAVPCPAGCEEGGHWVPVTGNPLFSRMKTLCFTCSGSGKLHAIPHRGFAHRIEGVRMGDCFERVCTACGSTNCRHDVGHDWRATPWLLSVVRQYPTLAEVVPSDREPFHHLNSNSKPSTYFAWGTRAHDIISPHMVLVPMQEAMELANGGERAKYPTRAEAITAMARAVVTVSRALVAKGGGR